MEKTAIVLGASGLVGEELVKQLLHNNIYTKVKIFVRNQNLSIKHPKLEQHVINFNQIEHYSNLITGDAVFCCLGTTIKKAGTKELFKKVDFTYPLLFAKEAIKNNVQKYVLISSIGANSNSSNFYLNVKGQIEEELKKLNFKNTIIVRPSMLLGKRHEFRFGEIIGKILIKPIEYILTGRLKKYKSIHANVVAKAMIQLSTTETKSFNIVNSDKLQELGKQ